MGLKDDILIYMQSKNSVRRKTNLTYIKVIDILNEYKEMQSEVSLYEKQNNCEHPMTLEVTKNILDLINFDDSILTIQDKEGLNIGMQACLLGLKDVAERAIENEEALLQLDKKGENLPCYFFNPKWEDLMLKALDGDKLCTFKYDLMSSQEYIGLRCVDNNFEKAVSKLLDHPIASIQYNCFGENILIRLCENNRMYNSRKELILKAMDNHEALTKAKFNGKTPGMMLAINGAPSELICKALEDRVAPLQVDRYKKNMGMYLAENYNTKDYVLLKALSNHEAAIQQDWCGENMGMKLAKHEKENLTLMALDNYEASIQQDNNGRNIGTIGSSYGLKEVVIKAQQIEVVRHQRCKYSQDNIYERALDTGVFKPVLPLEDDEELVE